MSAAVKRQWPDCGYCFLETLVDVAQYAAHAKYHPDDSREIPAKCIELATKFERIFHEALDSGILPHEDEYLEAIDRFCEREFSELASKCSNLRTD